MHGVEHVSGAPAVLKAGLTCLNDPSDARLAVQPISQNLNILRGYVQNDLGHGQLLSGYRPPLTCGTHAGHGAVGCNILLSGSVPNHSGHSAAGC
jgi:hypothetical protein